MTSAPQKPVRHFLSIADLTREEAMRIFQLAIEIKSDLKALQARGEKPEPRLPGEVLAMIFEKPSLRTRCTFETGMVQLGGHAIYLAPADIGLGTREAVKDVARSLGRWVQVIMARTFRQSTIVELAEHAGVSVINGLSDLEHPCQVMADFLAALENRGSLQDFHLAWIGDGNNVCNSLILLSALLETRLTMAIPEGYDPPRAILERARQMNPKADSLLRIVRQPAEAVRKADAVYTDVWASMGQESEREARKKAFAGFQVSAELMRHAPAHAAVMHDLPAHRGEEITDEMVDRPDRNWIFDQAENRLHAQKAIICFLRGQ